MKIDPKIVKIAKRVINFLIYAILDIGIVLYIVIGMVLVLGKANSIFSGGGFSIIFQVIYNFCSFISLVIIAIWCKAKLASVDYVQKLIDYLKKKDSKKDSE